MSDSPESPESSKLPPDKVIPDSGKIPGPAPEEPLSNEPSMEPTEDSGTQALSAALRSSFAIVKMIMIGLVVLFLFSGFFKVGPQERAIILRFGVPVGGGDGKVLGPGPKWAFPPPIDEVIKIPVGRVQSVRSTVGWYPTSPALEAAGTEPEPTPSLHPGRDGYLITGDVNIIHTRATLRYRIAEPGIRYMLEFASVSNVVRDAFNNSLIYAAARYRVDDVLTTDQAGFRETAVKRFLDLVRQYELGITDVRIDNVQVIPPRWLQLAFARVSEAEVVRSKRLNDSRSYENQTVSRARAQAEGLKNTGQSERTRLVEFIAAEVERFTNNLPAYRANPHLFIEQRRSEALGPVFTNALEKIVVPRGSPGSPRTVWVQINREPVEPKVLAPPAAPAEDHH